MIKFIITIYLLAMVTAWSDIQIAVADLQNTSGKTFYVYKFWVRIRITFWTPECDFSL